jgi:predicted PurR-regulated permease PerM
MSSPVESPGDLTRSTLVMLFILGLIGTAVWILRPFLASAVWATMIVMATWPLMLRVQTRLGNRRALAVAVMTGVLLLVYVVRPGSFATLASSAGTASP